jgi:hypothetical protein
VCIGRGAGRRLVDPMVLLLLSSVVPATHLCNTTCLAVDPTPLEELDRGIHQRGGSSHYGLYAMGEEEEGVELLVASSPGSRSHSCMRRPPPSPPSACPSSPPSRRTTGERRSRVAGEEFDGLPCSGHSSPHLTAGSPSPKLL